MLDMVLNAPPTKFLEDKLILIIYIGLLKVRNIVKSLC